MTLSGTSGREMREVIANWLAPLSGESVLVTVNGNSILADANGQLLQAVYDQMGDGEVTVKIEKGAL